ncbi:MAG: hypothetical protein NTX00_00330 [Candidatus Parcubacteria bacterium]|nr:hypothetical protein [Candidatus Parcubacteria bacterium]
MISIRNIEEYLKDHPKIPAKNKEEILKKAKSFADPNGIISGGAIKNILGHRTQKFLKEIMAEKHIKMAMEDIRKESKKLKEGGKNENSRKRREH